MNENEFLSSNFVSRNAIIVFFILSAAAMYFGKTGVAVLLMFTGIICLISRLWGRASLRNVDIKIEGTHQRIFKGESIPVKYIISNNKAIPLIWLEVMHAIPQRECAVPMEGFVKKTIKHRHTLEKEEKYSVKFTWLLPFQSMKWKTHYKAVKRGIYNISEVLCFSGDGFGFTIEEKNFKFKENTGFIVYPQIFSVNENIYTKTLNESSGSSNGYYEDLTVLKSTQNYTEKDSFKKINWRMAAKGAPLSINVYATILPSSCFFILDTASYKNEENPIYFENMLSLIASSAVALEGKINCGLAVPETDLSQMELIQPETDESKTDEILTALSAAEANFSKEPFFDEGKIISSSDRFGQIFICAHSADTVTLKGLSLLLKCPQCKFIYSKKSSFDEQNSFLADDICIFKAEMEQ